MRMLDGADIVLLVGAAGAGPEEDRVGLEAGDGAGAAQRVNIPLTAEHEGKISQVSAHWVLDVLYGDIQTTVQTLFLLQN